jgi:hypothetical protein
MRTPNILPMGLLDLLIHLLNFLAPALCVAGLMAFAARFFRKGMTPAASGRRHLAVNFALCAAVSLAGLLLWGRDGRMATYAVLVMAAATSQWWQLGGWKK